MVDDDPNYPPCLAQCLARHVHDPGKLADRLMLELIGLIAVPVIVVYIPLLFPDSWKVTNAGTMTWLKIMSIFAHCVHTAVKTPDKVFRWVSAWMMVIVMVLIWSLTWGSCTDKWICRASHGHLAEEALAVFSFSYMFLFTALNLKLRASNEDIGERVFINLFIYGVNLPSIVSILAIIAVFNILLNDIGTDLDVFLKGATAFLVFICSACSVCLDHFGQMFLYSGPCTAPQSDEPSPSGSCFSG